MNLYKNVPDPKFKISLDNIFKSIYISNMFKDL